MRVDPEIAELLLKLQRPRRGFLGGVNLVQRDNLRLLPNLGIEEVNLVADSLVLVHDVFAGAVQHVHQHPGALDVSKKLKAEADALAGTLQQTGDIRKHHSRVVALDDPQVGDDGGEGVVRDLGLGVAHACEQRALARVRHPDDPDIRHQPELHLHPHLHALLTVLGNLRSLVLRRLEGRVAPAAPPARYDHLPVPVREHLGDDLARLRVSHDGAGGYEDGAVAAVASLHLLPAAVTPGLRAVVNLLPKPDQRVDALVRLEVNGAAVAAVAAVRSALRHKRLAAKRHHPSPSVPSLDVNLGGVEASHLGRYSAVQLVALVVRIVAVGEEVVVGAEVEFHRSRRPTGAVPGLDVGVSLSPALEHVLVVLVEAALRLVPRVLRLVEVLVVPVIVDVCAKVHELCVLGADDVE